MTDLWEEATRDHEAEQLARRVTSARLALSSLTEFLTTAASKEEHTDRMALSADSIESAVAMATADDPGSFPIVHEAVSIELEQDFDAAFAVRQAEAQRRNAPRAARRQQARQAGWDPASTSDPHNPYAPIRSYTYTGPIESDADRGAATGIRCTVEGCSWSASSTDAHERFGGKGGDPMVNAWIEHAKSEMNSKYASRAARRSEQRVANAVEKDLADGFRSKIDPELAAKIPDDVGAQLWNRLVLEPLPSHLYDAGVSEAEMYRRRARELATNYLIPIAQGYASRRTATQYATVDLGPLGVHQIEGPWDVSYDSHYLQWSVYGLMDGLVTSLFSAPSRDEVDAWVAAHPMVNPDAGEQGTLARRKVVATDRCGDVYPVHIGNQTPMDVICHREKGHEGAHRGVTLDSDDNAITITWRPSTTASRVAALDEIDQAILEHAKSETGTIKPGDRIGNATVTEVGTHTIQLDYGDGWSGSRQIPFVGPQGEMYPSHQRALTSVRTASEAEGNILSDPAQGMPNDAFVEFRPSGANYSYPVNRNQVRINAPGGFRGAEALRRRLASLPKAPNIVVQSSASWYATTDQMGAAVGYLSREWGDHGYRIKQHDVPGVFECRASDGSIFYIASDPYGNTSDWQPGSTASRRTAGENPFPPGDKPASEDTKPEEKPEQPAGSGDDPTQMQPGQQVTITYTLTGEQAGSGDVEGSFESFDGTTALFTYEKGTFGVTNQNGTWVDAAGTTFTFAGAPAPEQEEPQEQAPDGQVPVDTTKKPVQSSFRRVASIPEGTFALEAPSGEMYTSSIPFTSPSEAAKWAYESNINWEALGVDRLDIVDSEGVKVTSVDVKNWSDLSTFASRRPFAREAVDYVTGTEWGVSYRQPASAGEPYQRTRLNVYKLVDEPNEWGGMGVSVKHPEYDGLVFDTSEEARQFAIDKGLVVPYNGSRTSALNLGVPTIAEETGRPADARVIMDQIGSMTLMSLGAREYVNLNDGLMFRVGAGNPLRKAIIKLNARDYYDVEIGRMNRQTLDWIVEYQQRDVDAMQLGAVLRTALGQVTEGRRVVAADPDNPYGVGDSNPYVVNERTPESNPLPPERLPGTPDDMMDGPLMAEPQTTKPRKRPSGAPANGSSSEQPMGIGSAAASRRA